VTAFPRPKAYTFKFALPRKMRYSATVNVDRLKPFHSQAGAAPVPGPVSDAGQDGEHEVELLLNRREISCITHCLVRWRGHSSADDECLRAEDLSHCQEKVAEYDAAAARRRAAPRPEPAAPQVVATAPAPAAAPLGPRRPAPPAGHGFRLAAPESMSLRRRFWRALPLSAWARRCSTGGRWRAGSAVP
jgi:hypothetical protein